MASQSHASEMFADCLGTPAALAENAAREYQRRSVWGRHPWLTFVALPIPIMLCVWTAFFASLMGMSALTGPVLGERYNLDGKTFDRWPTSIIWSAETLWHIGVFLPPLAVAVGFCLLVARHRLAWKWAVASCVLVALAALMFQAHLELPSEPGGGRAMLGFGLSPALFAAHLPQGLLPLLVALGFARRCSAERPVDAEPVEHYVARAA